MLSRCESSTLAQEKQVQGVSVIAAGRLHRGTPSRFGQAMLLSAPQLRCSDTQAPTGAQVI